MKIDWEIVSIDGIEYPKINGTIVYPLIPTGYTTCSVCGETKENKNFTWYGAQFDKHGIRRKSNTNCLDCQKSKSKDRKKISEQIKETHPKPEIGTPCSICGKPLGKNMQMDHDHETGEFRGWICKPCNTGLGLLGDNIVNIKKCLNYLIESDKRNENSS